MGSEMSIFFLWIKLKPILTFFVHYSTFSLKRPKDLEYTVEPFNPGIFDNQRKLLINLSNFVGTTYTKDTKSPQQQQHQQQPILKGNEDEGQSPKSHT